MVARDGDTADKGAAGNRASEVLDPVRCMNLGRM
jgi:hypothetical protein